jgi:hypothetical protein
MSKKSNVNPDHYKIAGRERQGEDIVQSEHKKELAEKQAREQSPTGQKDERPSVKPDGV